MESIKLYRKRFIPDEIIFLKDDIILQADEDKIITKWNVLKPRGDFVCGFSYYYLKKGYKISKFMDKNGNLVYYYCDIIDIYFDKNEKSYIFADLLADVIVYKDGSVKVVDLAEIAEALDKNLITQELAKKALRILDELLNTIYDSGIENLLCSEMRAGE
jgi:Uncharacterized conserved protein